MATLMRASPLGDLFSLPREIERVFDVTFPRFAFAGEGRMPVPTMDVLYRGDDMVIKIALPGLKESEIDIGVTDDVLTISGEHKEEAVTEREDYVLKESRSGSFRRQVALPKGLDPKSIHAEFTDGVLEVTVPKAKALEEPRVHHIAIGPGPESTH